MDSHSRELVLVACVHFDPGGYKKLEEVLYKEKPSHIFVELSPWGVSLRKRYSRFLLGHLRRNLREAASILRIKYTDTLKHPSIQSIVAKISIPYEYRASYNYSIKSGAQVSLVDSSLYSIKHTLTWTDLLDTRNLVLLLSQESPSLSSQVSYEYRLASNVFRQIDKSAGTTLLTYGDDTEEEREKWIFNQLRLQLSIWNPKKSVFIGGWKHFAPKSTFLRKLKKMDNLKTRLILLSNPPPNRPVLP